MYEHSECAYDTAGKGVTTADYGAYGTIRRSTGSVPIYGWCGMLGVERDAAIGLLFMRARYYSPMLGRFVSRDPIGLSGGDVNWYRYCGNASVLFIDPSGLDWRSILCEKLAWAQGFAQGFGEGFWEYLTSPRVVGAFQLIGGGLECGAGMTFAVVTCPTVAGAAGGGLVAVHGADVASAGLYALWYGKPCDTLTSQSLQAVGVPQNVANGIDAGLSLGGMGSIGAATKTLTVAERAMAQEIGALRSVPKTAASTLPKATVKATSPTVTESRKLGETVLRGVDDDCYVHFSQIEKLNSINANGLSPIGDNGANGAMYFFRVGDLKNATIENVKTAVGELAAAGKKIDIAVIVSPNAATFEPAANNLLFMEYSVWNGGKPFSVPVSSIIGVKGAVP